MRNLTALRARLNRRSAALAAVAVVAAIVAVSAAPTVARGVEGTMASTIFVDSETELEEARNDVIAAQAEYFDAGQRAAAAYDRFGVFAESVRPAMMSSSAPFESLAAARVTLKEGAKLRNAGEGRSAGSPLGVPPRPVAGFIPATNDGMLTVAGKNRDLAREYRDHAEFLRGLASKFDEQANAVSNAAEETLQSVAAWGIDTAAPSVRKSNAEQFDAMLVAIVRLSATKASATDRIIAFNSAYQQAKSSHDANLEAERAEAKRLSDVEAEKKAELDQIKADTERFKQLAAERKAAEKAQKEAERKAEEEKNSRPSPSPTPTPEPTPTLAPSPTATPTPSPTSSPSPTG